MYFSSKVMCCTRPFQIAFSMVLPVVLSLIWRKKRGFEVVERVIMPEELGEFDQCFLTGSAAEVTPVSKIDDHSFAPGDITRTLMDDYAHLVRGGTSLIVRQTLNKASGKTDYWGSIGLFIARNIRFKSIFDAFVGDKSFHFGFHFDRAKLKASNRVPAQHHLVFFRGLGGLTI